MSPEKKRNIFKWAATLPATFVLGVLYIGIDWKGDIEHTLEDHSDSIYVNAEKYEMLEERVIELQTLYTEYRARIESIEAQADSILLENNKMLRDIWLRE